MAIDKKIDYIIQDGYKNYIKNSDSITVPQKFQSRKNATKTKLAYITDAEATRLKKQNKGGVHKGPKGIPSYDDFDASGNYRSGAAMSAAETGAKTERARADLRQAGVSPQEAIGIRSGAVAAGAGGTKQEERAARQAHPEAFKASRKGTGLGIGNIFRGLGGIFGGAPGKIMSLLSRINPQKLRGWNEAQGRYNTQDEWEEDKDARINQKNIDRILNRKAPITSLTQQRLEDLGYTGEMPSIGSTGELRQGNEFGLLTDRTTPAHSNDLGNEFALAAQGNDIIPEYDVEYDVNTEPYRIPPTSEYEGMWNNNLNTGTSIDNSPHYNEDLWQSAKDGGRIGYRFGEEVEQETDFIQGPQGGEEFQETVVEGQDQPSREQLEALSMEIFQLPLEELDEQQLLVVYQEAMQGQPMEEAVQEDEVQFAANGGLAGLL